MHLDSIIILDFGSQYTQVIARKVREANVFSQVIPFNTPLSEIQALQPQGIILSGGPESVFAKNAPKPDTAIFDLNIPILGICYGLQFIADFFGGKVDPCDHREFGHSLLHIQSTCPLFKGIPDGINIWNSHGDHVSELPQGFEAIASTDNSPFAAIAHPEKRIYGLQYHPEVAHSEYGFDVIKNFLFNLCGITPNWQMNDFIEEEIEQIRRTVGDQKVVLGLSGGVDSSVAAALLHRAIGDQLLCIFVDNGLLRKNERQQVEKLYGDHFQLNLEVVDASKLFLDNLASVTDPETKRKIIGKTFIDVFEDAIKSHPEVTFLAQGTLYPDIIESVPIDGNPAALIKSHHNVGGLPEKMKLKLIEPLNQLFKDEVRELGKALGLPHRVLWRHPFPGPGLAVRVIGDITQENLHLLKEADAILIQEIEKNGIYDDMWQAFCVFLPVKSVGVMGDQRSYDFTIAIRMVDSSDGMTAGVYYPAPQTLQRISTRIINEVKGINRVVFDISSKPPSTIEWE